jgi:hypothetical protein
VSDVLKRIGAVNPVPREPPASAWTASVLLDEIEARRVQTTIDETVTSPVESPTRSWGMRIAAAAGAFVLVLGVGGVIGLIANGGRSEVVDTPLTQATEGSSPTTDAVSVAESFFTAFLSGNWDAANELAQGDLASGQNVSEDMLEQGVLIGGPNVYLLWEVEVVGTDCELVMESIVSTESIVRCTSTHTDALTRHIGAAYALESVGTMVVVDGVVIRFTSERQSNSAFDEAFGRYEGWLDAESPDGWVILECSHGGYWAPACIRIYVANVKAWLATDPDLSDIEG